MFEPLARERWLVGLERDRFVLRSARLLADMNAMHPFREGNGRSQRAFINCLANDAGWSFAWTAVSPEENVRVSRRAMDDDAPLAEMLGRICRQFTQGVDTASAQLLPRRSHRATRSVEQAIDELRRQPGPEPPGLGL